MPPIFCEIFKVPEFFLYFLKHNLVRCLIDFDGKQHSARYLFKIALFTFMGVKYHITDRSFLASSAD